MSEQLNENQNKEMSNNNNENNTNTHTNGNPSDLSQVITSSKVDLTQIDATEENLQNYSLSKQFLKLDLDKIRELIEILEEYCQSCIQKEDVNLAKAAKQRIILLKRIEKEKMMTEAKIIYSNQRELVQDKMKEDLENYLSNSNQKYESLSQKLDTQEQEMLKLQEDELNEYKKNFDQNYKIQEPRPSKECLNWMKIKEYAIRQNKFNKAQEAQREINKLKEKDNMKYMENKEKKFNVELNKINHRHNVEKNGFAMKRNSIIEEFNKNKNDDIEIIKKKYESKLNELKNYQNFEISNFDKITKGVIKPCSRIQSIVSSATGIKDEDEENDNNNIKEAENTEQDNKENDKEKQAEDQEQEQGDEQEENENESENLVEKN